jgi:hypothetical protein
MILIFHGYRAQGTGHRAQGTGHRAQGTGHRAQGTGHRAQGTERSTSGTDLSRLFNSSASLYQMIDVDIKGCLILSFRATPSRIAYFTWQSAKARFNCRAHDSCADCHRSQGKACSGKTEAEHEIARILFAKALYERKIRKNSSMMESIPE